jgi:hypothetical protein
MEDSHNATGELSGLSETWNRMHKDRKKLSNSQVMRGRRSYE